MQKKIGVSVEFRDKKRRAVKYLEKWNKTNEKEKEE